MTTSYKITDTLYLVTQPIAPTVAAKPVETNANHLFVFDCSGSMYGSLPRIREQIKNRLPTLAKPGDTATIIWFSGRGQFGVLVEGHVLNTAADFTQFNAAVDRWLRPMGLTGFKEPLQEAGKVIGRLNKNGFPFSLFFMSDGYDNQWNQTEILAVCDGLGAAVQSATIVEYGYYADRNLLTKMAERIGGSLIFAESFGDYEPTFEAAVQRRPMGKKIAVDVEGDAVGGIVWTFDGQPTVYGLNDGDVAVPEGIDQIAYLNTMPVGDTVKDFVLSSPAMMDAYVGMAVFAQRMKADIVLNLLKATGDVRFIKQFTNCFGKQSYSTFGRDVTEAAAEPKMRHLEGYDPNLVPRDDAFTVLDMLALLALDDGNKFYPLDPNFGYERIGRKTESSVENLTEAEQTEIAELTLKAKNAKDLSKVQTRLKEIIDSKPAALKFTADEKNPGVDVSALTTNETRPNISVLVTMKGTVDLTPIYDKNKALFEAKNVPIKFPTMIFRNYTVIADGIVNTKKLPVSLSKTTFDAFRKEGLISGSEYASDRIYLIDLTHLPTINRKMVQTVSAKKLFEAQFDLARLKAGNKVFGDALKKLGGVARSAGIESKYGKEVADILTAHGITDGGFSPKVVLAEAVDTYMGRELKVGLAGLSSLPKVEDVRTKNSKTISYAVMREWLPVLDQFDAIADEKVRRDALEKALKENREKSRDLHRTLNEQRFGVVVGQTWFSEFETLDQNSLTIDTKFGPLVGEVKMVEKEFKR